MWYYNARVSGAFFVRFRNLFRLAPRPWVPYAVGMGKSRNRTRANGEGWIKKRKDGRGYDVGLHVPGPDGTLKRKATTRKSRPEADAWLTEQKKMRGDGVMLSDDNPPLSQYLSAWLEDSVRGSVSALTYKHYKRDVKNHVAPVLGRVKIKALTPRHIQRLHALKRDEGLSVASRRHIHVTLKKALNQAAAWGQIPANPAAFVKPPKGASYDGSERADRIRPFSEEDLRKILAVAEGGRMHALCALAAGSGLREQELLALSWQSVELPKSGRGLVRVREAVVETEHGFEVGSVKTKKSRRTVEVPEKVVQALREHRQRQLEERLAARYGRWPEDALVFPNARGTLMNRYRLGAHFRPLREKAGVDPSHRFSDFRHTFATLLFARGVHPKVVQEAMGHASIRLTMDTYSAFVPGAHEGFSDALEGVF